MERRLYRDWSAGFVASVPGRLLGLCFCVEVVVPRDTYVTGLELAPASRLGFGLLATMLGGDGVRWGAGELASSSHFGRRGLAGLLVRTLANEPSFFVGRFVGLTRTSRRRAGV